MDQKMFRMFIEEQGRRMDEKDRRLKEQEAEIARLKKELQAALEK